MSRNYYSEIHLHITWTTIPGTRTYFGCLSNFGFRPGLRGRRIRPMVFSKRSINELLPKAERRNNFTNFNVGGTRRVPQKSGRHTACGVSRRCFWLSRKR